MVIEITMPRLGITMDKGKILEWYKKEGDSVIKDEPLLLVESEKINTEIESPANGFLVEILVREGIEVPVGSVLGKLSDTLSKPLNEKISNGIKKESVHKVKTSSKTESASNIPKQNEEITTLRAVPAARRYAKELGLNLREISATGPKGEILFRDVENAARSVKLRITPAALKMARDQGIELDQFKQRTGRIKKIDIESQTSFSEKQEEKFIVPNSMRKTIAKRLSTSFRDTPHIFLTREICVDNVEKMRKDFNKTYQQDEIKVSLNDILIKASARALHQIPEMNRQWLDGGIKILDTFHIGLATSLKGGLIVPVIRNADQLSLTEIAHQRMLLVQKAREGTLGFEEITGASMTITNLGNFGIDHFQAIINPPESCILSVGKMKKVPILNDNNEIYPSLVITVTLSVDHRVADGAVGAKYLEKIAYMMNNPLAMW